MNTTALAVFRRRALFLLALLAGTLAGSAHAQRYIYRGMRFDPAIQTRPITEVISLGLTVRPADVGTPAADALVQPTNGAGAGQGMSVVWSVNTPDACQLPSLARPSGDNWNGRPGNPTSLRVWRLDLITHPLPVTLATAAASKPEAALHALVTTVVPGMTLANLQAAVAGTAANWTIVDAPEVACPRGE